MLKGERVYQLMTKVLGEGKTFADLIVPFAVVTVDLHSGREVVLDRGLVVEAVRATISVPGVFLPVTKDPYRLVDGGILNNVPVDVVRNLGAKHVIAVDVMPNFSQNDPENPVVVPPLMPSGTPRFVEETWQAQMVMMSALTEYRLWTSKPDVLIRPILPRTISLLFGFNRASEAIAAGELAASEALPAIRAWL
jgi:NTE family protein